MRIALIHGDRLYRESLEFYLAQREELAVVYSAAIFEVGSNPCRSSPPELVLLEFGLCVERRAVGCDWFGANEVSPKLLIVGVPDSEEEILHCIETVGASGYLLKDASLIDSAIEPLTFQVSTSKALEVTAEMLFPQTPE